MHNSKKIHMPAQLGSQQGIALATALIFLVIITVLGLIAVRSSTTELQLAHNEQVRIEAVQTAQSVVDSVLANPNNLPVNTNTSYYSCYESSGNGNQDSCPNTNNDLTLTFPDNRTASDSSIVGCDPAATLFDTGVYAEARHLPPEDVPVPAAFLTSMDKFTTAAFSVRGQYACGNTGLGSADIEQGVLRLVPKVERIN